MNLQQCGHWGTSVMEIPKEQARGWNVKLAEERRGEGIGKLMRAAPRQHWQNQLTVEQLWIGGLLGRPRSWNERGQGSVHAEPPWNRQKGLANLGQLRAHPVLQSEST